MRRVIINLSTFVKPRVRGLMVCGPTGTNGAHAIDSLAGRDHAHVLIRAPSVGVITVREITMK